MEAQRTKTETNGNQRKLAEANGNKWKQKETEQEQEPIRCRHVGRRQENMKLDVTAKSLSHDDNREREDVAMKIVRAKTGESANRNKNEIRRETR